MQAAYIARRFGVFLLIVWLAATLNFFLPRLSGQDPVRAKLLQQAALGGYVQGGIEEMTREYERAGGTSDNRQEREIVMAGCPPTT